MDAENQKGLIAIEAAARKLFEPSPDHNTSIKRIGDLRDALGVPKAKHDASDPIYLLRFGRLIEGFGKALAAWLSEGAQEGSPATPQRAEEPPAPAPAAEPANPKPAAASAPKTASPGKPVTPGAKKLDEALNAKQPDSPVPTPTPAPARSGRSSPKFRELNQLIDKYGIGADKIENWCKWAKVTTLMEIPDDLLEQIIGKVKEKYEPAKQEEQQEMLV